MKIWPGWLLTVRLERIASRRCGFTLETAGAPTRCMFNAGHPAHGHTCISDLTAPAEKSPGALAGRTH